MYAVSYQPPLAEQPLARSGCSGSKGIPRLCYLMEITTTCRGCRAEGAQFSLLVSGLSSEGAD